MSECSEDMCLVKNGSSMYLGDNGAKELVIICDHVYFFHKNEWTRDCFLSPKGAGPWWNPCDTDTGNERETSRSLLLTVCGLANPAEPDCMHFAHGLFYWLIFICALYLLLCLLCFYLCTAVVAVLETWVRTNKGFSEWMNQSINQYIKGPTCYCPLSTSAT